MSGRLTRATLGLLLILVVPGGAHGRSQGDLGSNMGQAGFASQVAQQPAGAQYYVYGRYDVTFKGVTGPLLKGFMFAGTFRLPADPGTSGSGKATDTPAGTGRYFGQIGVFEPGQTECRPMGGYDYPQGEFDIVATVEDGRLGVWIVPHPPASDPLLDVFDTRFSPLEAGAKHLDVPLQGGAFTWGGGITPMKIECHGIQPGSQGGFGVSRMRGG